MTRFWIMFALLTAISSLTLIANEPPADVLLPNDALKTPFKDEVPITFLSRNANAADWAKLPKYWNEVTQDAIDPTTGAKVARRAIQIKVPLGLSSAPTIPAENPMTLAKWNLGKKLYFDPILSSDRTISCASCHAPDKGYTDQSQFSTGIGGNIGGANAPTVMNAAFNRFQFWDGRAASLEDQSQGPPTNPKEMFHGKSNDPWGEAIARIRAVPEYVSAFNTVFGHAPTRDAVAKAIATYERTVLVGNSIYDRAEVAMRKRIAADDDAKPELKGVDFTTVITEAIAKGDTANIGVLGADAAKLGDRIANGRALFFGKARCTNCHVGDNFSDGQFHNLGVGAKDGKLSKDDLGRFGSQPTGHKDPASVGAYKTPGLRGLSKTAPYMHDGSEKTLEEVVEFYDRGGNANPYLSEKMRDTTAEAAYLKAKANGAAVDSSVNVFTLGGRPIIPLKLNLTKDEKTDLVLFMKALESDPVDATIADPTKFVK